MAYSVDTYSGSRNFVVEDGTINSNLDIRLIGKNYAGYGEVQNENFLHLLENFAGETAPLKPIAGQLWYDSKSKKIKYWDSSAVRWKGTGGTEVSPADNPPAGSGIGDLWWDTTNQQLYIWNGTTFVLVGPDSLVGLGTTQIKSVAVTDTAGGTRAILQGIVGDSTMFIVAESEFELNAASATANPGFGVIKKGITLKNHNNSTGVTDSGETTILWGAASNSLRLGGYLATDYLRANAPIEGTPKFNDTGYIVGSDNDLAVSVSGSTVTVKHQIAGTLKFQTTVDSTTYTPLTLVGTDILPGAGNATDLGSATYNFKNVYASSYYGSGANLTSINAASIATGTIPTARLTGTYGINISGNAATASSAIYMLVDQPTITAGMAATNTSNGTVAVRTNTGETINGMNIPSGALRASCFLGVSTATSNADLAEKYLADAEYEVGTVVSIGGTHEITACSIGDRALGAVSGNPAYMMNSELADGTFVALKGRVPVKVIGPVNKGDRLVAANNGSAMAATASQLSEVFAIALESNADSSVKFVEAVIL